MITIPRTKKRILIPQEARQALELINIKHGLGKFKRSATDSII